MSLTNLTVSRLGRMMTRLVNNEPISTSLPISAMIPAHCSSFREIPVDTRYAEELWKVVPSIIVHLLSV